MLQSTKKRKKPRVYGVLRGRSLKIMERSSGNTPGILPEYYMILLE
jgi:hypothetical protein